MKLLISLRMLPAWKLTLSAKQYDELRAEKFEGI
jgi:hypothetical protein